MPLHTDALAFLKKQMHLLIGICLFTLFFSGSILKLYGIINWSDFILLLTLIVIIIYTYYTYKLTRISMLSPSLLAARQAHSDDLKKFLNSLLNGSLDGSYESYINFDNNRKYNTSNLFKKWIESNWMYKDILEYHVPVTDREKIRRLSDKIEQTIDKYIKSRLDLIEYIEQHLSEEPKIVDLAGVSPGFSRNVAIYTYELYARRSSDVGMRDFPNNQSFDNILTELKDRDYCRGIDQEILKIKKLYEELTQQNEEIKDMLSPLLRYPILPGMNCDILKPLWEEDINNY